MSFAAKALLWGFHNARSGLCFPSYETIAARAGCARSTVAEAIKALEDAGLLTWVNRIKRVRERCEDLFGHRGSRVRVIRTSNGYRFNDPKGAADRGFSSKSDFPSGTPIGAHDFEQSSAAAQNRACNNSDFRGVSRLPHPTIFPALPGHRPAFLAGFVFLGADCSTNCDAGLRRVTANPELICLIRRKSRFSRSEGGSRIGSKGARYSKKSSSIFLISRVSSTRHPTLYRIMSFASCSPSMRTIRLLRY